MKQIVLMYHDIYRGSASESGFQNPTAIKYKVRADRFEAQVAAIKEYIHDKDLSPSYIDFTFDDGGVSFLTIAAPVLEKYGFRGTFYISTGLIGRNGFLNSEQIKELERRGHIVGSHSHSHPERMSAMTKDQITLEWQTSQDTLTKILGHTPDTASIPNGYSSKEVLDAMISSGITSIDTSATTTKQSRYLNSRIRGRYAITDDMTTAQVMQIITSPAFRFKKAMRWQILQIAKALLGNAYLSIRSKISI